MRRPLSATKLLLTQPYRFKFDAALRILMRAIRTGDPAAAAEFRTQPGRFYPAGDVTSVVRTTETRKPRMTVAMIGLIGSGGALPRLVRNVGRRIGSPGIQRPARFYRSVIKSNGFVLWPVWN